MVNGHDKQIQVNPAQAAAFALQFLENVVHTRAQREAFDMAVGMLQAIATGQVVLAPPPALPQVAPQVETAQ
jgi:hypothetical protein